MLIRDSKPGRLFPNPGFRFGRPQARLSGSGFATLKSRRQRTMYKACTSEHASIDPYYDAALHYAEERMICHHSRRLLSSIRLSVCNVRAPYSGD